MLDPINTTLNRVLVIKMLDRYKDIELTKGYSLSLDLALTCREFVRFVKKNYKASCFTLFMRWENTICV